MSWRTTSLALMCLTLLPASLLAAPGDQDQVKFAVHLVPAPAETDIATYPPPWTFGCDSPGEESNLNLQGALLTPYYLYAVILDIDPGPGVAGVRFSIEYGSGLDDGTGVDISSWHNFGQIEFPDVTWPASGASNTMSWNSMGNCQNTVDPNDPQGQAVTVAYGFYVYAYGEAQFRLAPHALDVTDFRLANCAAEESTPPDCGGIVGFGNQGGFSPCFESCVIPVEAVTWGRVKRTFSD